MEKKHRNNWFAGIVVMLSKLFPIKYLKLFFFIVGLVLLCVVFRGEIYYCYERLTDREYIKNFVSSYGYRAPVVFILIQVFQVLFAPVPGEATGFIGGYVFGTAEGFLYSSIGLTAGSWINFIIGRFLGNRYIRKLIPVNQLERFDTILKRQGIIILFILFVFPGFPKDYLCFFLGFSAISFKLFMILAAIGRMPGTFMLSLEGAFLNKQMYGVFALILVLCFVVTFFVLRYRENLYQWVEKLDKE